jgi:hypothetical protein
MQTNRNGGDGNHPICHGNSDQTFGVHPYWGRGKGLKTIHETEAVIGRRGKRRDSEDLLSNVALKKNSSSILKKASKMVERQLEKPQEDFENGHFEMIGVCKTGVPHLDSFGLQISRDMQHSSNEAKHERIFPDSGVASIEKSNLNNHLLAENLTKTQMEIWPPDIISTGNGEIGSEAKVLKLLTPSSFEIKSPRKSPERKIVLDNVERQAQIEHGEHVPSFCFDGFHSILSPDLTSIPTQEIEMPSVNP